MTQRERIQIFLIDLVLAGAFYAVRYDANTNKPIPEGPSSQKIPPRECLCNELTSNFDEDRKMGRRRARDRTSWMFQVKAVFPCEVSAQQFEEELLNRTPFLEKQDPMRGVSFEIQRSVYDHPVTQNPSNGSSITFEFDAVQHRA